MVFVFFGFWFGQWMVDWTWHWMPVTTEGRLSALTYRDELLQPVAILHLGSLVSPLIHRCKLPVWQRGVSLFFHVLKKYLWPSFCFSHAVLKKMNFDFIWCSCHKLIPQLPLWCTCQASLCALLLIGWVALLPWHLVATATRSLAPIHHPDQDWHLMTSSLPIRQACCYYECPSVYHFQLSSGGFKNRCSSNWNGE